MKNAAKVAAASVLSSSVVFNESMAAWRLVRVITLSVICGCNGCVDIDEVQVLVVGVFDGCASRAADGTEPTLNGKHTPPFSIPSR